ncbi:hypothetical protein GUJ93_ZPchr0014g47120 [Zizania palustris]|uniref:Uncharacterized protein n=1 Tax=Zizania palustris TaxID=103762 RepID=A0A8J5TGZ8_ZIZPA|nr:hypothetical protein GUJ93_ZPchr0014g47120 [Zizania palustris]
MVWSAKRTRTGQPDREEEITKRRFLRLLQEGAPVYTKDEVPLYGMGRTQELHADNVSVGQYLEAGLAMLPLLPLMLD